MLREQKGITLVALVITIIVLLILAGVTIAALSGENGILTNASNAQIQNAIGNAKDQVNLAANEGIQAFYNITYLGEQPADTDIVLAPADYANAGATVKKFVDTKVTGHVEGATVVASNNTGSDKNENPYIVTITTTDKTATVSKGKITKDGAVNWE